MLKLGRCIQTLSRSAYFVTDVPRRNARLFLTIASNRFSKGESYAAAFRYAGVRAFAKSHHHVSLQDKDVARLMGHVLLGHPVEHVGR